MKAMFTLLTVGLCLLPSALRGQAPPSTEVYLAPLTVSAGSVKVGAPVNISNNAGYDNQPSFPPDSSAVLFASNRDGKQNDIYRWTIATKTLTQLTKTGENEYSPLVATDGRSFITVHGTEQSLFRYDLDGGNPRMAFQYNKELIGYHVWLDATQVATFVLGQPATLQVLDTSAGTGVTIDSNIGRSLLKRPGTSAVSYVSKKTPGAWTINQFDAKTHAITTVATDVPRGSEDLTWLPDGKRLIMAQGNTLRLWTDGAGWSDLTDLTATGVTRITRLAASPNGAWLAIVGEPAR